MRCSEECHRNLYPIPKEITVGSVRKEFSEKEARLLRCPSCVKLARPHVLWFDEFYDEEFFSFNTSINIAENTDVLITVGTSGATTLPNHIIQTVISRGGLAIDINPESNPFGQLAVENDGYFLEGSGGEILQELLKISG